MTRHQVRFSLSAGKHNVPGEKTGRFLAALVKKYDLQLILTTESQDPGIVNDVRKALGDNWQVRRAGEYLCAWRRDTFSIRPGLDGDVAILRRFSDVDGLPDWQNVFGGLFRLTHTPSGRPITPVSFHSNAGIEMGDGFRKGSRLKVLSSKTGLTRLGNWAKRRLRGQSELIALIAGDANVNQFRATWRRYMLNTLGGVSIWQDARNTIGDHAGRLIVVAHAYGRGVKRIQGRIIRRDEVDYPAGYDHGALVGTLVFTSSNKEK